MSALSPASTGLIGSLPELQVKPWLQQAPKPFYLTNATIVDASKGQLIKGEQVVKIENGHFVEILPQAKAKLDPNARCIDVKGKYICPGLIDAHVHVCAVPGVEVSPKVLDNADVQTMGDMIRLHDQVVTLRTTYVLRGMLRRGFTSVRDTGGATKFIANAVAEGLVEGPRLFQCGKAISQTGGHGDLLPGQSGGDGSGCCGGNHAAYGRTADGVPACLKAVREELKQGADFIKIMLGGGVSSETDAIDTIQYTSDEVKAITTTAWQMGKKMVSPWVSESG